MLGACAGRAAARAVATGMPTGLKRVDLLSVALRHADLYSVP